jgi:hypothetical protein
MSGAPQRHDIVSKYGLKKVEARREAEGRSDLTLTANGGTEAPLGRQILSTRNGDGRRQKWRY